MVLLLLLKLSFALAICQALQGYIQDENENYESRMELYVFYGSFLRALYTMFEITHSGSWPSRVRPVIDRVSPWYAVAFLGYITLVPRSMNLNSRAKSWNKPSMFIHVCGKTMRTSIFHLGNTSFIHDWDFFQLAMSSVFGGENIFPCWVLRGASCWAKILRLSLR